MARSPRDAATERQVEAADPGTSTWLSANAGSGKTRVLTDRVARLLLHGVRPENVLCLTYTKAAASEMQNRLFKRLGEWAMLSDLALAETLTDLGAVSDPDGQVLADARRLFARAIETPGGLKIQTIHSFCSSVLRRFPLEAGLTPGFREMDDVAAADLQAEVMNSITRDNPSLVSEVANLVSDEDFGPLCYAVLGQRHGFARPVGRDDILVAFGLGAEETPASICSRALREASSDELLRIANVLSSGSKLMQDIAPAITRAAKAGAEEAFDLLCGVCLVKDRSKRNSRVPTAAARAALGDLAEVFDTLADALMVGWDELKSLEAARRTEVLHRFAGTFLPAYDEAKASRGLLDFDDLINLTEKLLSTPGVADWVLYKLDGEIQHVLVDEAQDTSPVQWRVIDHLTREFTSGDGALKPGERTLFVVGDLKQSIYSFQGAAPDNFVAMRDIFGDRLGRIGTGLLRTELEYSFRSAPEILEVVDRCFPLENRAGLGDQVEHLAFRTALPGKVELWDHVPVAEKGQSSDWWAPVDEVGEHHHTALLAQRIAEKARRIVDRARIPDGKGGIRAATAGDILILVQSRGPLFDEIIAACKSAELEVAGADRLKLGEELAVRDVLALLRFLDTPEDDLSLASALRSPLFGWGERDLYELAHHRAENAFLWQALRERADDFPETVATLRSLREEPDFLRPFDLIERILTRHDGRRRLIARLGEEAADGIDALRSRALAYEQTEIPSLTGFLAYQERVEADVKRQPEARGTKLRVMTVHGAKGLESPIVILPDTALQRRLRQFQGKVLETENGMPVVSGTKAEAPLSIQRLRDLAVEARVEEARRLLYVAMTRAETWLIVAAAGDLGTQGDSWYEQISRGMQAAGAKPHPEFADGLLLQSGEWPEEVDAQRREDAGGTDALPEWALQSIEPPVRPEKTLSPSDLGGAKALAGEGGLSKEDALLRGTTLHALLEHLSTVAPDMVDDIVESIFDPDPVDTSLVAEAQAVLTKPELSFLFGPNSRAEVPVTATLQELGGTRIHGTIDRLVVGEDWVLAADFKSNAQVPEHARDVPHGLLRQLGAYAAALEQIYPSNEVKTALIWTKTAEIMYLPQELTTQALARAKDEMTV